MASEEFRSSPEVRSSGWKHEALAFFVPGAGLGADGAPAGYTWDVDRTQHVVYRSPSPNLYDRHIHELWFNGVWHHNDLTLATGAPGAVGNPAGYTWDVDRTQHVVYRGSDGHIHELWFSEETMSSSVRIMPLGDSITLGFPNENTGGYRGPLYQILVNAGYAVDFVGSLSGGDIADPDHEGHNGSRADMIADNVYAWLMANPPEIVLLHIGTNDILQGRKAPEITKEIARILNNIDSYETFSHTPITVILAQIISHSDPLGATDVETTMLNRAIASMAVARIAAGDRLVVANFEPALSSPEDLADGVHPNASGYGKMAMVWFKSMEMLAIRS